MALLLVLLLGCVDGVTQVAGVGATYMTRCSADMEVRGVQYLARCEPPSCDIRFESSAVNHVVVALDPGSKVIGYAERVCVQDLSNASAMFSPEIRASEARTASDANTTDDAQATESP